MIRTHIDNRSALLAVVAVCCHACGGIALAAAPPPAPSMGMGAATPLALVAQSATADALVDCIGRRLAATGPAPIPLAQLSSGLEARIGVHELPPRIATASLSLKPAPDFMSGVHHDDDPEAHPEIVKALLGRMRIPLITRAWAWQGKDGLETCLGIAKWLGSESRRPVVLDPD